jgi:ribosomal protein S18 acetylase RimI-like enzyme
MVGPTTARAVPSRQKDCTLGVFLFFCSNSGQIRHDGSHLFSHFAGQFVTTALGEHANISWIWLQVRRPGGNRLINCANSRFTIDLEFSSRPRCQIDAEQKSAKPARSYGRNSLTVLCFSGLLLSMNPMPLHFRLAVESDFLPLTALVIEAFEPITWQKKLDRDFGPLKGRDWRQRWSARLERIFQTQIVLVGESAGELAAMATATLDPEAALGFIDVLAVGIKFQGQRCGRQMLRGIIDHLKTLGCQFVNLDCLTDNEVGNSLYASEGFVEVARHVRWFKKI